MGRLQPILCSSAVLLRAHRCAPVLLQDARSYPMALLKVLTNITDVRVVQYALTIAEDFLAADPSARAKYFLRPVSRSAGAGSADRKTFFTPFLQLVGTTGSGAVIASKDANPYVLERAAACASLLLSVDCSDAHATPAMLAWVFTHIRAYGSTDPKQVKVTEVAVTSLRTLLRNDVLRKLFVLERGVEWLVPLLTARNTQLLYDSVFCIWSLSLDPAYTKTLETTGAVTAVSHLARANMPLKLVRVAFALIAVSHAHTHATREELQREIGPLSVFSDLSAPALQQPISHNLCHSTCRTCCVTQLALTVWLRYARHKSPKRSSLYWRKTLRLPTQSWYVKRCRCAFFLFHCCALFRN